MGADVGEYDILPQTTRYCMPCFRACERVIAIKKNRESNVFCSTPRHRCKRLALGTPTPGKGRNKRRFLHDESRTSDFDHSYGLGETVVASARKAISRSSLFPDKSTSDHDTVKELIRKLQLAYEVDDIVSIIIHDDDCKSAVQRELLKEITTMCDKLCSLGEAPGPSVLRGTCTDKEDLISNIILEMSNCLPFMLDVLKNVCSPSHHVKPNALATIANIYGMAMHCRNQSLSLVQEVSTCAVLQYSGNNNLLHIFNKASITLAPGSKIQFLDKLSSENTRGIVRSLQYGGEGKVTVDNIDGQWHAGEYRKGKTNSKDFHYTASTYLADR